MKCVGLSVLDAKTPYSPSLCSVEGGDPVAVRAVLSLKSTQHSLSRPRDRESLPFRLQEIDEVWSFAYLPGRSSAYLAYHTFLYISRRDVDRDTRHAVGHVYRYMTLYRYKPRGLQQLTPPAFPFPLYSQCPSSTKSGRRPVSK